MQVELKALEKLNELRQILDARGVHETLRFLNSRTPHRFTGVYRFDGPVLRNEHLFDQFNPEVRRGDDVPMEDAYCALLQEAHDSLQFSDARTTDACEPRATPVVSYCGVLIRNKDGTPFGTLCHYDVKPCQKRVSDVPLLEAIAPDLLVAVANG